MVARRQVLSGIVGARRPGGGNRCGTPGMSQEGESGEGWGVGSGVWVGGGEYQPRGGDGGVGGWGGWVRRRKQALPPLPIPNPSHFEVFEFHNSKLLVTVY